MANIKAGGQIALRFPKQDDLAALREESNKTLQSSELKIKDAKDEAARLSAELDKMKSENQNLKTEVAKIPQIEIEKKYLL